MNASKSGEISGVVIQFKMELRYYTRKAKLYKPLDINFIREPGKIVELGQACIVLFSRGIDYA